MSLSEDAMRDDENPLRDIDLSAWEVPAPRGDLADTVVARMREVAAVSPVTTAIVAPPSHRRWLVAGGLAAVCAAAIVIIVLAGSNREDAHGSVGVADRAQHLDLGTTSAELDPGADVRWQRDHQTIHVEQPRGVATWKVGPDEQLLIDPGAMGASIEATGASLRVEVQMNHTDGRVIAASATTAAIAAIVTVIVYEGHVNVRNSGQTITVAPGSTVEIAPNQPPREPFNVGLAKITAAVENQSWLPDCEIAAMQMNWLDVRTCATKHLADNPTAAKMYADRAELEMQTALQMTQIRQLVAAGKWAEARRLADTTAMPSMQHYKVERLLADVPCGAADLVASAERDSHYGLYGDALVKLEKTLTCQPDPAIDTRAIAVACQARAEVHAGAYLAKRASSEGVTVAEYCDRNGAPSGPATVASCDPTVPHDQGIADINLGQYAAALTEFERALACKPSQDTIRLAYLAACHSKNSPKAREYFGKLPTVQQRDVEVLCLRDGIAVAAAPTCDANAPRERGIANVNLGQYVPALAAFEQALACKTSTDVIRLAYLAACNGNNAAKARLYFSKLPPAQQRDFATICARNGIVVTTAPTCDAGPFHDRGVASVNLGQYAAALASFEQALACKPSSGDIRLAYVAACNSKNAAKARLYFSKLPSIQQRDLGPICEREGITVDVARCDAAKLKDKGVAFVDLGNYAEALTEFEQSLACKSDSSVVRLAFLASCHAKDADKARHYFSLIPPGQQATVQQICIREGIDVSCDAQERAAKAKASFDLGQYTAALSLYEESYKCKPDLVMIGFEYLAACKSKNAVKARQYFSQLSASTQKVSQAFCLHEGIQVP
jgi:tetratricopeptide (TPR) repeat protein